jgi:hypothetical protein
MTREEEGEDEGGGEGKSRAREEEGGGREGSATKISNITSWTVSMNW